jgi:hypothetical protein
MSHALCTGCSDMFLESDLVFTDSGRQCSPCAAWRDADAMNRSGRRNELLAGLGLIVAGLVFIAVGAWLLATYMSAVSAAKELSAVSGGSFGAPAFPVYYILPIPLGLASMGFGIQNLRG